MASFLNNRILTEQILGLKTTLLEYSISGNGCCNISEDGLKISDSIVLSMKL
jgi:hypothetical protein